MTWFVRRLKLAGVAALVVATMALLGCPAGPPVPGTQSGNLALDFALTDAGGTVRRLSDYAGSAVWVQFINVLSPNCQIMADESVELFYTPYADEDLVILAVLVGDNADGDPVGQSDCAAWAALYGLPYPVLYNGSPDTAWQMYNDANKVPLSVFVDREGVISYKLASAYTPGGGEFNNVILAMLR